MSDIRVEALVTEMWRAVSDEPAPVGALRITGPDRVLPSVFGVTTFATSAIATATLAAAELLAAREDARPRTVTVDRRRACAAFLAELLFEPHGWETPPLVDPVSGDYRARDGWIRLHTTYPNHRLAALAVLGVPPDRVAVAEAVAEWDRDALETAVVDDGGCAAAMYTRDAWLAHPAGATAADEPAVARARRASQSAEPAWVRNAPITPLAGIRVLDLTRAIAGPVCTQFLAAHGAEVVRIDHPDFVEVPPLEPVTTAGKRVTRLDLRVDADRRRFEQLLADADVLVSGLRPDALAGLGYDTPHLVPDSSDLILVDLDAYGWNGAWAQRRGFDSLVQMSSGIAAAGGAAVAMADAASPDDDFVAPRPLPAQALDHGTGYLLATAVCRALTSRVTNGTIDHVRGALVGTSNLLVSTYEPDGFLEPSPAWDDNDTAPVDTAWGPARAVRRASTIEGVEPVVLRPSRPLGSDDARFD